MGIFGILGWTIIFYGIRFVLLLYLWPGDNVQPVTPADEADVKVTASPGSPTQTLTTSEGGRLILFVLGSFTLYKVAYVLYSRKAQ